LGIPATVFLATGLIGTRRLLWTADLGMRFRGTDTAEVDLSFLGLGRVALKDAEQRQGVARAVVGKLKTQPPAQRDPLLNRVRAQIEDAEPDHAAFAMMDWGEVLRLETGGLITFGAHTVNHEILSRLDDDEVRREVHDSVAEVRRRVRNASATFAYPNGTPDDFDCRAADAARSAGVTAAVSTIEGFNGPHTDIFALRRFNIGGDVSFDEFRVATAGVLLGRSRDPRS
jgi:peptidoglycan/xylan/chitin deacetylase (PgdA/CDA1 family)